MASYPNIKIAYGFSTIRKDIEMMRAIEIVFVLNKDIILLPLQTT